MLQLTLKQVLQRLEGPQSLDASFYVTQQELLADLSQPAAQAQMVSGALDPLQRICLGWLPLQLPPLTTDVLGLLEQLQRDSVMLVKLNELCCSAWCEEVAANSLLFAYLHVA